MNLVILDDSPICHSFSNTHSVYLGVLFLFSINKIVAYQKRKKIWYIKKSIVVMTSTNSSLTIFLELRGFRTMKLNKYSLTLKLKTSWVCLKHGNTICFGWIHVVFIVGILVVWCKSLMQDRSLNGLWYHFDVGFLGIQR